MGDHGQTWQTTGEVVGHSGSESAILGGFISCFLQLLVSVSVAESLVLPYIENTTDIYSKALACVT